jgi:acyl carrier protein
MSHYSHSSHSPQPIDREAFFALAARVFGVERAALSGATAYQSIPGWDSVNHLRLVMETERAFGVRYPLERIPSLTTLDDFLV